MVETAVGNVLLFTHLFLFIDQIQKLKTSQDSLYHFHTVPCQNVHICGMIVGLNSNSTKVCLDVDDGTGSVACIIWNPKPDVFQLRLGDIISINGRISEFESKLCIYVKSFAVESDPHAELFNWVRTIELQAIYKKQQHVVIENVPNNDPQQVSRKNSSLASIPNLLKGYLKNVKYFQFDQLSMDTEFQNFVKQFVPEVDIDTKLLNFQAQIAAGIRTLEKQGFVFHSNGKYEVIGNDNLGVFLLECIQKELWASNANCGLFLDEIYLLLNDTPYSKVPKNIVYQLLQDLTLKNRLRKQNKKYFLD
jgi:hypothetical protein